jgi:hypothetical protein
VSLVFVPLAPRVALLAALAACASHEKGQITADEVTRACASAYSCYPFNTRTVSDCLNDLDDPETLVSLSRLDQIHCLALAGGDCAASRACLGYTVVQNGCPTAYPTCNGDVLHTCTAGIAEDYSCAGSLWYAVDAACLPIANNDDACGLRLCTGSDRTCEANRVIHCNGRAAQAQDCPIACLADAAGINAACGDPDGAACDAPRCDGATRVDCVQGQELRVDCAAELDGGTCLVGADGLPHCRFASECEAGTAVCAGDVLPLCTLGRSVSLDCKALGFKSCDGSLCLRAVFP